MTLFCLFCCLGAIGGRGGAETFNTILTEVNCLGNESSLLECSTMTEACASQEIATVICQGIYLPLTKINCCKYCCCYCCPSDTEVSPTDCSDGDVRLVDGDNSLEGRLEVCFNRVWGTVCDTGFNADDAQVICNQLMIPFQGM